MDITKYNKYIRLSNNALSNFKYIEFIKSQTAVRKNINNIPQPEHFQNMENLVNNGLQPVRDKYGPIIINSGYRSPELCKEIGSTIYSNHTNGGTADIEPVYANMKAQILNMLNFIHNNLDYRELIAEFFPNGWIHYSYLQGGNKRELKLKDSNHNYNIVSIEYINSIYKS